MFHQSIDVPLLNARETHAGMWKRLWYAAAIFFGSITITTCIAYIMTIYNHDRDSKCQKQIAIISGLDLLWVYIVFIFFLNRFQHHKIRMLVGEILGIFMIPLYALTIDSIDKCDDYMESEPLYDWLIGWAACATLIFVIALCIWLYTLSKWCFFPKGLRITWNEEPELHSDHRESSINEIISGNDNKLPDNANNPLVQGLNNV